MSSVAILGRQPAIGLAELESLYGAQKVRPLAAGAAEIDVDPCLFAFDRLGGTVKFCKRLTELHTTDWKQIEAYLVQVAPDFTLRMPPGKMNLGLSAIGFDIKTRQLTRTGLELKKAIKKTGRNVRVVPNNSLELSSAQVHHNQLTNPTGWELIFIRDGDKTLLAQTVKVQDIESYTYRDRERPRRDARVGMLPPKLAQIIINLAVGEVPEKAKQSVCEIPAGQPIPMPDYSSQRILDPFCGTGVVMQEALLMGYSTTGSDVEPRMVQYTQENLAWLANTYHPTSTRYLVEGGDATDFEWHQSISAVATETYLGRPFTSPPPPDIFQQTITDCDTIIGKFLKNIHDQLTPGTRLCLAIPAWQIRPDVFKQLPLVDHLVELGYNRVSFTHVRVESLIYYRADQIVARELLVITRK